MLQERQYLFTTTIMFIIKHCYYPSSLSTFFPVGGELSLLILSHDSTVPERALKVLFSLSMLVFRLLSEMVLSLRKRVMDMLLERLLNTSSTPGPLLKMSLRISTPMVLRKSGFR